MKVRAVASSVSWPPFCQKASISDFDRVVERLKYITGRPLPELTRPIDRSFGSEIFSLKYLQVKILSKFKVLKCQK